MVHFREGSHLEDLSMLFPPVKESRHFRLRLKVFQMSPKGRHPFGDGRAVAELLVCSKSISHLYCYRLSV